jgi:hypothetical protein
MASDEYEWSVMWQNYMAQQILTRSDGFDDGRSSGLFTKLRLLEEPVLVLLHEEHRPTPSSACRNGVLPQYLLLDDQHSRGLDTADELRR